MSVLIEDKPLTQVQAAALLSAMAPKINEAVAILTAALSLERIAKGLDLVGPQKDEYPGEVTPQ